MERVGRKVHFTNLFFVPRVNTGGGLALYWKFEIAVDVKTFSDLHINVIINQGVDDTWRFTDFYGDPDTTSQKNSWGLF